jgi:hypothetical protein
VNKTNQKFVGRNKKKGVRSVGVASDSSSTPVVDLSRDDRAGGKAVESSMRKRVDIAE